MFENIYRLYYDYYLTKIVLITRIFLWITWIFKIFSCPLDFSKFLANFSSPFNSEPRLSGFLTTVCYILAIYFGLRISDFANFRHLEFFHIFPRLEHENLLMQTQIFNTIDSSFVFNGHSLYLLLNFDNRNSTKSTLACQDARDAVGCLC